MANIRPDQLGAAISAQLTQYHESVVKGVDAAGQEAIQELVKRTKATAPKKTGDLAKNIAWKAFEGRLGGKRYVWHVKAPDYRIAHLVVHGHAKANGGRVPGNPFLQRALDEVLPTYEQSVEEAVRNG